MRPIPSAALWSSGGSDLAGLKMPWLNALCEGHFSIAILLGSLLSAEGFGSFVSCHPKQKSNSSLDGTRKQIALMILRDNIGKRR